MGEVCGFEVDAVKPALDVLVGRLTEELSEFGHVTDVLHGVVKSGDGEGFNDSVGGWVGHAHASVVIGCVRGSEVAGDIVPGGAVSEEAVGVSAVEAPAPEMESVVSAVEIGVFASCLWGIVLPDFVSEPVPVFGVCGIEIGGIDADVQVLPDLFEVSFVSADDDFGPDFLGGLPGWDLGHEPGAPGFVKAIEVDLFEAVFGGDVHGLLESFLECLEVFGLSSGVKKRSAS